MEQLGQSDESPFRLLLAFGLALLIITAWQSFFGPKNRPVPETGPRQEAETPARPEEPPAPTEGGPLERSEDPENENGIENPSEALSAGAAEEVILENDRLRLVFHNRGAVLTHAYLKGYEDKDGGDNDLVSPACDLLEAYPLAVVTEDQTYNTMLNEALFHVERSEADGASSVIFRYMDEHGNGAAKTVVLPDGEGALDLTLSLHRAGGEISPVPIRWGPGFAGLTKLQARNPYNQQDYAALSLGGSFKKVRKAKKAKIQEYGTDTGVEWAAASNNYFAAVFVPEAPLPQATVVHIPLTDEQKELFPADSVIALDLPLPEHVRLHLIPKRYALLREMGGNFTRLADWGRFLGPICVVLFWGMEKLHSFTGNYGFSIILLTLVVKLLFFPFTHKSMVMMKQMGEGMKKLQPQVDRLKAKYKKLGQSMENRQKMNEEMMALYQREGINPMANMAGCLPILLQMPIFFALFTLLPRSIELRGAPFVMWIQDLSIYDPYFITPIGMGVAMCFSTLMTSSQMQGAQKTMMWMMPVFFTFICLRAPAGLTIYWLTNTLLSMVQQGLINRQFRVKKEAEQKSRKSTPKKQSKKSHG